MGAVSRFVILITALMNRYQEVMALMTDIHRHESHGPNLHTAHVHQPPPPAHQTEAQNTTMAAHTDRPAIALVTCIAQHYKGTNALQPVDVDRSEI